MNNSEYYQIYNNELHTACIKLNLAVLLSKCLDENDLDALSILNSTKQDIVNKNKDQIYHIDQDNLYSWLNMFNDLFYKNKHKIEIQSELECVHKAIYLLVNKLLTETTNKV